MNQMKPSKRLETTEETLYLFVWLNQLRSPRRGERGHRSPTSRRLHQRQQRSGDEDDEDDEDDERFPERTNSKYAEMQAASRRLERRLPELERRFQESSASRQEVRW